MLGDIRLWVGPRIEHLLSTWDLIRWKYVFLVQGGRADLSALGADKRVGLLDGARRDQPHRRVERPPLLTTPTFLN